jgi:hypothetical protein
MINPNGTDFQGLRHSITSNPTRASIAESVRGEKKKRCCGGVISRQSFPMRRLKNDSQSPVVSISLPPGFIAL